MKHQYELRHLRYFLAVAEELHFRKAAEKLFVSQPGLSRQIKELEENLGLQLFERHNRKVALTKAGLFLKKELLMHFKGLEHSFQQAKLLQEGLLGDLRFGYVGSAMQEIIPQLLLAFREGHPQVMFSLKEMENQKQIDALQDFDLDLGFVRWERFPRGLQAFPLRKEPFCLVLPQDHPLQPSTFVHLKELKNELFILFSPDYSPSYFEKIMQIFDDSGFVPRVTHQTIHSSSIYKLVENHFGVSIVPRSLRMDHLPGIKFIELSHIPQRTTLSAVWNQNNRNPILPHFLGLLQGKDFKEQTK